MKFRWTIKELKESSDNTIVRALIAERKDGLNPYAPLAQRLRKIYASYDEKVKKEKR